jgi:methionyl-tRNA formyltransferase
MNIVFFGMPGDFSALILWSLLAAERRIMAIVLPAAPTPGAAVEQLNVSSKIAASVEIEGALARPNVLQLAAQHAIPVYALRRPLAAEACALLDEYAPDAVVVACFPWLIPPALLTIPRHGFWNVHPSLLPAHRGPDPLLAALRSGSDFGVSIHQMDENFDTGPLAAQAAFDVDDNTTLQRLQLQAAQLGGELLNDTLDRLASGTLTLRPQL